MANTAEVVQDFRYRFVQEEVKRLELKYSMPIDVSGYIPDSINSKGWIYILSNSCMPGLLKIGMTTNSPQARAKEISSSTGVPEKFVVEASYYSDDPRGDEARIHSSLSQYRINTGREFFRCSLADANEVCKSYCLCDAKASLEEIANDCSIICSDAPIKLDAHEWLEELGISYIGSPINILKAIFELGYTSLERINHDGLSVIIEGGFLRGIMTESHQSYLAHLEDLHERELLTGIYGPRLPGGF